MKHSKFWTPLVLGTCLVAAVSCGSDDDDSGSGASQPEQQPEQQTDVGQYNVTFTPVNAGVGGNAAAGTGTVTVDERNIAVQLNMTGVPARITHLQHITTASACPTAGSDANGDGFVDVVEGVPSYGQILVPLDNNLSSQTGGASPRSDSAGAYSYSGRGSYTSLLNSLQREDTNTNDAVAKLPEGENLNLEQRVIIVHGIPTSVELPETVASLPGSTVSASRTIPIACGTITRAADGTTTGGTGTGTTTGETGTTTGETGTTTGETGTTTGETGTTTGETGTTTGETGTTTGETGTTTGGTGTTGTTTGA